MKKISIKQKTIIIIALILIVVILSTIFTVNIMKNKNLSKEGYMGATENASSTLVASYIKEGITIGGITGTLEVLDTSDATAKPEDIAWGKTGYVNGKKIIGTYMEGIKDWIEGVPIPDGFYYVGGKKETGIIISDRLEDENKGVDYPASAFMGNQFVWVPVTNPSELFVEVDTSIKLNGVETTTNVYSNLSHSSAGRPGETSKYREPDVLSNYDTSISYYKTILGFENTNAMADSFATEYKEMSDSIKKYNGFFIGRYEITANGEKTGATLINKNWFNLYKACKNVVERKVNVKSMMIYAIQWDATMEWFRKTIFKDNTSEVDINSTGWGNYSGKLINTGSNTKYKVNEIFDLAGNCWELTQGAYSTSYRSNYGGDFSDSKYPASYGAGVDVTVADSYHSSRATLCIE